MDTDEIPIEIQLNEESGKYDFSKNGSLVLSSLTSVAGAVQIEGHPFEESEAEQTIKPKNPKDIARTVDLFYSYLNGENDEEENGWGEDDEEKEHERGSMAENHSTEFSDFSTELGKLVGLICLAAFLFASYFLLSFAKLAINVRSFHFHSSSELLTQCPIAAGILDRPVHH